jgi:hypothetical protein
MYKKSSNYKSESCKSEAAGKAAGKVYMFYQGGKGLFQG